MAGIEDTTGVELFDSFVDHPDLHELDAWLASADDTQLRRAAAWLRTHKAALEEFRPGEAEELRRARRWAPTLVIASCAPPGEAVKTLAWNDFWFVRHDDVHDLLVGAFGRRPLAWAEAFVPGAAQVKLARRREASTAPFLFRLLDGLIRQHDLPAPDGDAFLHGWACTRDDRYLSILFPALFRSAHLRHRPGIAAELEAKVDSGEITRAAVVAATLEALVVPLQPSAQKVLADVLARLELTSEELAGRLPLLQNALGTAHGSVTAVLLPLAVSSATEPADLAQIATVIAGRTEKRQKSTLLALLEDLGLRERLGADAVLGALALLGECDAVLRERAARLARTITGATEAETAEAPLPAVQWAPLVRRRPVAEPLRPPSQLGRGDVARLLHPTWTAHDEAIHGRVNRVGHAVLLECIVRMATAGRDAARAWLPAHDAETWRGLQPVQGAIICWLRGDLDAGPVYDDRIPADFVGGKAHSWRSREHMVNAAAREALWRAGRVPTVLSTPSLTDGTLQLEELLQRIVAGRVPSYTPYDLALALLRLRPVSDQDLARLAALGGLTLPAEPVCWAEHARHRGRPDVAPPDGVDLIQRWVGEGGLRPLDARWRLKAGAALGGGISWDWGDDAPLPTGVLDSLLVGAAALADMSSTPTAVTSAPWWTDLAAANLGPGCSKDHRLRADVVLDGPGPVGTPGHAVVLAPLAGPPDVQRRAVLALLELVRRDALSVPHLRHAVEILNDAGALPLARVALGLEQAFDAGGLADLWEVALGVTADATRRRPLPSGLPDLLRMLAAYLPSVPDRDLPAELVDLANARGTSKSHAEARALLAVGEAS